MITLEEAIKLATKAHEGQWRKAVELNGENNPYLIEVMGNTSGNEERYTCEDGTLITNIDEVTWTAQEPYITHSLAVMGMMTTEEEKIVAVLHDVIKNCKEYDLTFLHGGRICIDNEPDIIIGMSIYESLLRLTRTKNESYIEYIQSITPNKLATKVKIADICHNLSDNPSKKQKEKYLKALPVLLQSI